MITKEKLLSVRDLNLAGKIEQMSDMQFDIYLTSLNGFVDGISTLSGNIKNTLKLKTYNALAMQMTNTSNALTKLHANGLAEQWRKQADTLRKAEQAGKVDHDELEAVIENLIQGISALSIEIQMSEHKPKSHARAAAKPSAAQAAAPSPRPASRGKRSLIYAVDNAIMFLTNLERMLVNEPYELKFATECDEALEYLSSNTPDMILLDIEMPEMDGFELARRIKNSGQKAPILFITANSDRECVNKAVEVGAVGLLMKPLRIGQLKAKLEEFA